MEKHNWKNNRLLKVARYFLKPYRYKQVIKLVNGPEKRLYVSEGIAFCYMMRYIPPQLRDLDRLEQIMNAKTKRIEL